MYNETGSLEAVVLSVVVFDDGSFREPGMGMKFVKIGPEDAAVIKAFIHEQAEEGVMFPDPDSLNPFFLRIVSSTIRTISRPLSAS